MVLHYMGNNKDDFRNYWGIRSFISTSFHETSFMDFDSSTDSHFAAASWKDHFFDYLFAAIASWIFEKVQITIELPTVLHLN